MRDKYGVSNDPYCWPGTSVLHNTLGIRDGIRLADAEIAATSITIDVINEMR